MYIQDSTDRKGGTPIDEPGRKRGLVGGLRVLSDTGLRRDTWRVGWMLRDRIFQSHHTGVGHPVNGIWTNKLGGEFSGVHLQGNIP